MINPKEDLVLVDDEGDVDQPTIADLADEYSLMGYLRDVAATAEPQETQD